MILELNKEQKDYIIENYGSSMVTINKTSRILNELDLPFYDEEDYISTVCTIASIMETEKFNRELKRTSKCNGSKRSYTISEVIIFVLNQKFNDNYLYNKDTINKVSRLRK